mgnify:FL=1
MTHPSEAGHWYDKDGKPCYEVPYADPSKGLRPATLGDAKKLGLYPGVTTIIREAAKPGLERWKQEQILLAALTLPKIEGEPEADYIARIIRDSQEQGKQAAAQGTEIHAAIEGRNIAGAFSDYVFEAVTAVQTWMPGTEWTQEQSFSHPSGFGGKVDDHTTNALVDYKSTDKPLETLKLWDEHAQQLAAYREGLGMPQARCAIVYVSRLKPEARLIEIPEKDLQRGWDMFQALLSYFYARTGLKR